MIDLSAFRLTNASPTLLEFGGLVAPPLGGPGQRIDRAGDRWSMTFATPRLEMEPEGRRWAALLVRAKKVGVRVPIVQYGFPVGVAGNPSLSAGTPAGRFIPASGLTPGYSIRAGQWLNVFDEDGNRYLDQIATGAVADQAGEATIELQNLLRAPLAVGSKVELTRPMIEGDIGGSIQWPVDVEGLTGFEFVVSEIA